LSPAHQAVLEEGIAVWEAALADENRRALSAGWELALSEGVIESVASDADQARFDAIYEREAERNAAGLARYGIDGMKAYGVARASVGEDGSVTCKEKLE
jgi:hypothetical protein